MRAAEHLGQSSSDARAEHLVIACTGGANRTSLEALQPADGLSRWWFDLPRHLDDAAAADGMIFVATHTAFSLHQHEPGTLFALRASDRAVLWRTDEQALRWQLARLKVGSGVRVALSQMSIQAGRWAADSVQLARRTSLAADGGMLFACSGAILFAFDARSGGVRWASPTLEGSERWLYAAHGGRVYVGGDSRGLLALDGRTGKSLWCRNDLSLPTLLVAGEACVYAYPLATVRRGRAARAPQDVPIGVLRAADGTLERTHSIRIKEEALAALTAGGIAYIMRNDGLHAVQLSDGEELWRSDTLAGTAEQGPESLTNLAHVEASDRHVFYSYGHTRAESHALVVGALDATSGIPLWQWRGPEQPLPSSLGHSLTAALDNLYVTTQARMLAFRGANGHVLWQHHLGYSGLVATLVIGEPGARNP